MNKNRPMTAERWNRENPTGTTVRLTDAMQDIVTKTRSEAWELGHGEPVVLLEGKRGGYGLDFLTPIIEEQA